MGEIEVGEYVRTEGGLIAKYLGFKKDDSNMEYNKHLFDNKIYWYYEYYNEYVYEEDWKQFKEDIVNHSKNLIDLVDKDDYVNGYKVIKLKDGFAEGTMAIVLSNNTIIYRHHSEDIKTILTKEQMEANQYVVK